MTIRTDCYIVKRTYEYDPERVKKAFEIILNIKSKDKEEVMDEEQEK